MRIKCSVYLATSVDGFIAKSDGDIEWLHQPKYAASDINGLSYDDFISTVDALLMGGNTFEKVLSFGGWPYEETPVVVLSSRELAIPEHLQGKVRAEWRAPEGLVSSLESEGKQHLYQGGDSDIGNVLNVNERLHYRLGWEGDLANERPLSQKALAEVLAELTRP